MAHRFEPILIERWLKKKEDLVQIDHGERGGYLVTPLCEEFEG